MRPQVILTFALLLAWLALRSSKAKTFSVYRMVGLVLPVVVIVGVSAWRYHYLTGDWALISGNGPVTKLFGVTRYKSCEAYDIVDGQVVGQIGFGPPSSSDLRLTEDFKFEGRIIDADIIEQEIRRYQSTLTVWDENLSEGSQCRTVGLLEQNVAGVCCGPSWPSRQYLEGRAS